MIRVLVNGLLRSVCETFLTGDEIGGAPLGRSNRAWDGIGLGSGRPDGLIDQRWCDNTTTKLLDSFRTQTGIGAQNTVQMDERCTGNPRQLATNYAGGGLTDWFLPTKDELNVMYLYTGSIFDKAKYGFASDASGNYWSSSQASPATAWGQALGNGAQNNVGKSDPLRVRPIRAF